jgi:hypothetical protein
VVYWNLRASVGSLDRCAMRHGPAVRGASTAWLFSEGDMEPTCGCVRGIWGVICFYIVYQVYHIVSHIESKVGSTMFNIFRDMPIS